MTVYCLICEAEIILQFGCEFCEEPYQAHAHICKKCAKGLEEAKVT